MNETDLIKSADFFRDLPEDYAFGLKRSSTHPATFVSLPLYETLTERGINAETNPALWALLDKLPAGVLIAGGYVSNLLGGGNEANDIDLFFSPGGGKRAPQVFEETVQVLLDLGYSIESMAAQDPATGKFAKSEDLDKAPYVQFVAPKFGLPVQAVKISWYAGALDLLDGFDFTCIQACMDVGARTLVLNPIAGFDFSAKLVVQHNMETRERVANRLAKYYRKGFRPPAPLRAADDQVVV